MSTEIPVTQARDELAELINRVAYGHERIILTRHSKAVACLVPPEDLRRLEALPGEGQEPEGQTVIRLTSTGQSAALGQPAPLRIAAEHRPTEHRPTEHRPPGPPQA